MQRRTFRSGARIAGTTITLLAVLTGCTLPDVSMSPGLSAEAATPSATSGAADRGLPARAALSAATPVAQETPPRPAGELDAGSVTHALPTGDRTVVIDYWTDQDATSWTADSTKRIQLSGHLEGGGSPAQVLVTRFVVTADDGATRSVVVEDRGEFVLTPPFSYATALTLPESSPSATSVTLYVQFDLLVETAPRSGRYYRQTVLDDLELPFVEENSP